MIDFKEIELKDKEWVDQLLSYSDYRATEFNFTVLFIWKEVFCTRIGRYKDFLVVRFCPQESIGPKYARYLFPVGKGDYKEVLEVMMADARALGAEFTLTSVLEDQKQTLENLYPDKFQFESARNSFDYVYLAQNLITLKGKKYQSKRNFVSRFKANANWSYEEITPDNTAECLAMSKEWCKLYGCMQDMSMQQENCSVTNALRHFSELGLKGGLLRLDGEVVAFTIGEKMNSDTMLVHIEKAYTHVTGAYPTISQMFLQHQMAVPYDFAEEISPEDIGFIYVNREDDAGDENLRKAKLQYNPIFLIEKYIATISEN